MIIRAAEAPVASRREIWSVCSEIHRDSAGSFRQARWIEAFLRMGFHVRVISVQGPLVVRVWLFRSLEEFRRFRSDVLGTSLSTPSARHGGLAKILRYLRYTLLIDFLFPSLALLFLKMLLEHTRTSGRLVILTSSPPLANPAVALAFRVLTRRKAFVSVDMRDPWAMHPRLGGIKPVMELIERTVLRGASAVSTVSKFLQTQFEKAYHIKVTVQYNVATRLVDEKTDDAIEARFRSLFGRPAVKTIAFTGSLPEGFYDLDVLARGIGDFYREKQPTANVQVRLIFVGKCDNLKPRLDRSVLDEGAVTFIPHVPHRTARALQDRADILLFLGHQGEGNWGYVTTKLFEYFASGKPILPIGVRKGSDVDDLLQRFCKKSAQIISREEICSILEQIALSGSSMLPTPRVQGVVAELEAAYDTEAERYTKFLTDGAATVPVK